MTAVRPQRRSLNGTEKDALAILAIALLFAISFGAGSSAAYAGLSALYLASVIFAIRCVGGLRTVFGGAVLYFSLQHVLVSQVMKAVLGEAPESRLLRPIETMASEILVMLGFAAAGLIVGRIHPNRGRVLFPPITDVPSLKRMASAAFLLSLLRTAITLVAGNVGVTLISQLSIFDSIAVASAVAASLIESGGKRLFNPLVWLIVVPIGAFALVGGARAAVAAPLISLMIGGWAFGYRYRFWQFAVLGVFGLFMVTIISPYGLAVRGKARGKDFVRNINTAADIFTDVVKDPAKYQYSKPEDLKDVMPETLQQSYFRLRPGNASNILNRFALIKTNDLIVDVTLKEGTTGWANISPGFTRLVPGFIGLDKNILASGNMLAHRVPGMIGRDDYTTGITVGLSADSFSAFAWWGVFLLPLGILFTYLVTHKLVMRLDMRRNVYGIAIVVPTSSFFSEQNVLNAFAIATYSLVLIVMSLLVVNITVKLLDFRYLRPARSVDLAPEVDLEARA